MTRKEYESKPADYRGFVNGKPYLLHMGENGMTVYEPVEFQLIVPLICCCCNGETYGRQWYNRDTGYGLCSRCADLRGLSK